MIVSAVASTTQSTGYTAPTVMIRAILTSYTATAGTTWRLFIKSWCLRGLPVKKSGTVWVWAAGAGDDLSPNTGAGGCLLPEFNNNNNNNN